jgi:hypothetical protein
VIWQLAWRNITDRPLRALLLLLGYGLGVAVMITLLAVGEAMLTQAREEKLVGGGDITVLPDGIDLEVLKTGGLGGMFFSVPNARFVYRQVLASPRHAALVQAVAPQLDNKLLYLTTRDGRELPVRATGELPDATRAVGAGPTLAEGAWVNDAADDRWAEPTLAERRHDTDRFHLPPPDVTARASWGEWHYFNVLSDDASRWAFISFIVGGDIPDGEWGGQLLVTMHERGRPARRFSASVPGSDVRFSTTDADLRIGEATVTVRDDGAYEVRGRAVEEGRGTPLALDLVVRPAANAEFPGATLLSGDFASGYTVPGLRASATGTICAGAGGAPACDRYDEARAYHDHNWGVWRGVTWEWGAARAGNIGLLYGRVQPPDSLDTESPLFVYVTDSLGFVALFRPRAIAYEDARSVMVGGRAVRVPASGVMEDVRGADTLRLELFVDDAAATDTRAGLVDRGESALARQLARPYFVQLQGRIRLTMRVRGVRTEANGTGFFETYR